MSADGNDVVMSSSSSSSSTSKDRFLIALVCASNVNRSMEAHSILQKASYAVESFGAGTKVRLPGESADSPNVYDFLTPYKQIYQDLNEKNKKPGKSLGLYQKNGMLPMMERNMHVKLAPQRWQDIQFFQKYQTKPMQTQEPQKQNQLILKNQQRRFDIVITYEKRIFDIVVQDLEQRSSNTLGGHAVHVLNLDTTDNTTEAANSAQLTLDFVNRLYETEEWEDELTDVIQAFEEDYQKTLLYSLIFI